MESEFEPCNKKEIYYQKLGKPQIGIDNVNDIGRGTSHEWYKSSDCEKLHIGSDDVGKWDRNLRYVVNFKYSRNRMKNIPTKECIEAYIRAT